MRNSFLLYAEYEQYFDLLKAEEQAKLIKALFAVFNGKDTSELEAQMEGATKMAFAFMRTQLENDTKKYQEKCDKLRENGAKGGAPKGNQNAKINDENKAENVELLETQEKNNQKVELGEENNQNNQKVIKTTKNNQKQQVKVLDTKDLVLEEVISLVNNKKINIINYIINARARAKEKISSKIVNYPVKRELEQDYVLTVDVIDLFCELLSKTQEQLRYKEKIYETEDLLNFVAGLQVEDVINIACQLAYGLTDIQNKRAYIVGAIINKFEMSQHKELSKEEKAREMQELEEELKSIYN